LWARAAERDHRLGNAVEKVLNSRVAKAKVAKYRLLSTRPPEDADWFPHADHMRAGMREAKSSMSKTFLR